MSTLIHRSLLAGIAATWMVVAGSADAARNADIDSLHKELEALKQGQDAMAKDIAEIKKLLEPLRPPPPVKPVEGQLDTHGAPERGNPQATVAVVEFSDFQCPFCKRHVDTTLPQIDKEYISTGKVRYVFMDFPLESIHPMAFKAAEASHCAEEQQRFWEMHDRMFADQDALAPDQLVAAAKGLGLDEHKFKTCLDSGKYADRVKASVAEGEKFNVGATPAVLLATVENGEIKGSRLVLGALPYATFKEEIDKLLGGVAPAPAPTGTNTTPTGTEKN